jgi:hypothetical protein
MTWDWTVQMNGWLWLLGFSGLLLTNMVFVLLNQRILKQNRELIDMGYQAELKAINLSFENARLRDIISRLPGAPELPPSPDAPPSSSLH